LHRITGRRFDHGTVFLDRLPQMLEIRFSQ
jgi:hypothetical protein